MMMMLRALAYSGVVTCLLSACGLGTYEIAIGVVNNYNQPIQVIVAANAAQPGPPVGEAFPSVIEAHDALNVRLVVPATRDWAVFINPPIAWRPGPLFTAADTRGCRGRIAIEIAVGQHGGQISVPEDLC